MTTPIRLAALDMAGTTVADDGAVEEAFQAALDALGLVAADLAEDPGAYVRRFDKTSTVRGIRDSVRYFGKLMGFRTKLRKKA